MNNAKNIILEILETLAVSFIIIYIIYRFVASMEVVSGGSMEPNFYTDERILVDRVTPLYKRYQRGEVVVLNPPNEETKHYLKRIIALPGEIVKILDCKVYVSNDDGRFLLDEDYLAPKTCTTGGPHLIEGRSIKLLDNEYLVLGDNRAYSIDSRFFGVVKGNHILGRVIFVFWPPKKVGFVKW